MHRIIFLSAAAVVLAGGAGAGGIDRTNQPTSWIFNDGTYVELGFGASYPSVSGADVAAFGSGASGNVAGSFFLPSLSLTTEITDKLTIGVQYEQPFGADLSYGLTSAALGGTTAQAETHALSLMARYKFTENFSAHALLRGQTASGVINLNGLAYGGAPPAGVSGYGVTLGNDTGYGYGIGAAYEIPEIALRFAITYYSAITHNMATTETGLAPVALTSTTAVQTPQSLNIDFQTGIAENTLLFAGFRWADWSNFNINPVNFVGATGEGLVDLPDSYRYTLGIGRQFSDTWAGSFSVAYEPSTDPLVSPLAPTNGQYGATIAAVYTRDNYSVTTGVNYTLLGDAQPETGTPDTARATFTGNSALSVGVKLGFQF